MAQGRRTDDDIREEIAALYTQSVRGVMAIKRRLEANPRFTGRVPADRSISRVIAQIRAQYPPDQQRLDERWRLRPAEKNGLLPDGIAPDAIPDLLECERKCEIYLGRPFTIRDARWVNVLRHALSGEPIALRHFAFFYANRERWAAINNAEIETDDLDAAVMFTPWRSEINESLYRAVIETRQLKAFDLDVVLDEAAISPQSEASEARAFKGLLAMTRMAELHESLPEERRDEFWAKAEGVVNRPEPWTIRELLTGRIAWKPDGMLAEINGIADILRETV